MALHRDIFWIGRQWAVTGSGIQAVDQRLKGAYDVDHAMVWDDGLLDSRRDQAWFNAADFEKALTVARARFPAIPRAEPEPPAPACPPAPEAAAVSAVSLQLATRGRLARFLPQWRVRR
ncbi:conserved hypothetical protein [Bradyrhizobium oligotrophicum S58]|uniref:Uncharacterized protein n=1 Tax=Bradyrhizobium oligotrophicum S58 TaxID=1245469 RepID=M4Z8R9_9BRAD|nr:hypothetical protein [Bradyrhizobium oligotrophicum]BAM89591.1 conserved hypothetical protein [Bradyrhizobium oligotrophicum S58]